MNVPRVTWGQWEFDRAAQRYFRRGYDSVVSDWVFEWDPNPQGQAVPGVSIPPTAHNPSVYPPAQYGGDGYAQSSATVENITTRLGAHTIRDDDDKADSRSIPNSRPDVSSANPIFKVIQPKDQRRFFRKGKVIKLEWVQPRGQPFGDDRPPNPSGSNNAITEIRRFVIISPNKLFSLCLPIQTYGGRATLHRAAKPVNHVQVFSGDEAPDPLPGEKLTKRAIKIVPKHGGEALVPASRLDLAKIYTVEHNIPVAAIGEVDKKDWPRLERYFQEIHKDLFKPEDLDEDEDDDDEEDEEEEEKEEDDGGEDDEGGWTGPARGEERTSYASSKPRSSKPSSAASSDQRRKKR